MLFGAAAIIIGAPLPWAVVSAGLITISRSGMVMDGWLTIGCATWLIGSALKPLTKTRIMVSAL